MRSIHQWLHEYSKDHQNPTNKRIHWICVPLIVWSLLALLWTAPFPGTTSWGGLPINWAVVVFVLGSIYYSLLSWRLAIGLIALNLVMLYLCLLAQNALPWPLWQTALAVFVLAWIGQFIGHNIEGRRPAFFTDIQFLMIGPAWVVGYCYQRLGLRY